MPRPEARLSLLAIVVFSPSIVFAGRSNLRGDPVVPPDGLEPLPPADSGGESVPVESIDNVHSKVHDSIHEGIPDPNAQTARTQLHNRRNPEYTRMLREEKVLKQWFSWEFWQMLVLCTVTLFFFSEVVYPVVHIFRASLLIDATIFFLQMLSFMIVAAVFATPESAAAGHASALSTIMMAISFLIFLVALATVWGEKDAVMVKLDNDIGSLFCPTSRAIGVFLIVQGVMDETGGNFDSLTLFASFAALGIAFAIGDVVKDVVSYLFIRHKHLFIEEDFVEYQGEIYQVRKVSWRNTEAYRMKTRSVALIPNSKLALSSLNNQSKDDARTFEFDIPLPGEIPGENLQTIVREAWALLRGLEETGFKAFNGENYGCQIDVSHPETGMYLADINPGVGEAKEFPYIDFHIRLMGKYYYSNPPPWKDGVEELSIEDRQLDWLIRWKYQVEWFIVEIKKIVDRHSA